MEAMEAHLDLESRRRTPSGDCWPGSADCWRMRLLSSDSLCAASLACGLDVRGEAGSPLRRLSLGSPYCALSHASRMVAAELGRDPAGDEALVAAADGPVEKETLTCLRTASLILSQLLLRLLSRLSRRPPSGVSCLCSDRRTGEAVSADGGGRRYCGARCW